MDTGDAETSDGSDTETIEGLNAEDEYVKEVAEVAKHEAEELLREDESESVSE